MSQALYRKYRPKTFAELVGQEHISRILQNAVKNGRIVHSYLFTGPRGIGKTTIARLLAKTVNCSGRAEGESEPCDKCDNCLAMNAGNALNIVEIDAASNTGVDNVREKIIENIRFAPSGAKYRVFIIDETHMLSPSAFNALLKTLEEPPAHAIFILATTELHKVPATIVSRCQRYDFKNFSLNEIVGRLELLAKSEGVKVAPAVLERIAYLAEGGLRDAESLLGQLFSLGAEEIGETEADLVLPKGNLGLVVKFLECLVYKNGREAMMLIEDLHNAGTDLKYFTDEAIDLARAILQTKLTGEANKNLTSDMADKIAGLAANSSLPEIVKILDTLIARRGDLRLLSVPSLPLELAAAELCGNDKPAEGVKNFSRPLAVKTETEVAAETFVAGDLAEIEAKWPEVLVKIKDYNHSLPFILGSSRPVAFDGKTLTLAIKFKLHKDKLDDLKSRATLTEVLKCVYNKSILLSTIIDERLPDATPDNDEGVPVEQAFG
jgi:DNA polymerase-3 subunit gamma/tau